ncbi:MAPEG family protein, partial [Serratia marcescens]|uniref:MAPEG family protein n=1 Tax=Serratia marcescens TaxID=615 RepID=UPI00195412E6
LIAFVEAGGGSLTLVRSLLIVLLIARLLHPIGMFAPPNSPRQFDCRGGGVIATFSVIAVAAVTLLVR